MTFESFTKALKILDMSDASGYYDKNLIIKQKFHKNGWGVYIKYHDKLYQISRYRENEDGRIDASLHRHHQGNYDFADPKDVRNYEVVIEDKQEVILDIFEDRNFQIVLKE